MSGATLQSAQQEKGVSQTAKAFAAQSPRSGLAPFTIRRRAPGPQDVQIDILYCGVCHSDLHQVRNELQMESQLYGLVGTRLKSMGHNVRSSDGAPVGGYEGIMFTPDASAGGGCSANDAKCSAPMAGFYRAGSNFREDGQPAGY